MWRFSNIYISIWVTWLVSNKEQDLLILRKHLGSPPGFRGVHVAHLLVFCVVIILLAYDPCLVCIFSNYLFMVLCSVLLAFIFVYYLETLIGWKRVTWRSIKSGIAWTLLIIVTPMQYYTINDFIRWTLWFINPEEVMFTEANGFIKWHIPSVSLGWCIYLYFVPHSFEVCR
jgi:hypothetical protein